MATVHKIGVYTTTKGDFPSGVLPYANSYDQGFNPTIEIINHGETASISLNSTFKLRNNRQTNPKDRLDIYLNIQGARDLISELSQTELQSELQDYNVNPDDYRTGKMRLPGIQKSATIQLNSVQIKIGELAMSAKDTRAFVEQETPVNSHVEMRESEVHIGIPISFNNGIVPTPTGSSEHQAREHDNDGDTVPTCEGSIIITLPREQMLQLSSAIHRIAASV